MFLRSSNNSLVAGLDATSLASHSDELSPSTSAKAEVLRPSCSDTNSPLLQASGQADGRPLPFWPRWSQPNKLRRVLQLVQAWLGAFPRHFRQACNPKQRPWQFLARAFLQCWLLPPERLAKCKVGQTLLSRPLSQLFRRWHFLSLLCLRVSRLGFSPRVFLFTNCT